jgi:protein O-mannosyl-transferase
MKTIIIIILFMLFASSALAVGTPKGNSDMPPVNQNEKPKTVWAIIVGISKYQNIESLNYADRDAIAFYNYLLSPAGGSVDTNNIKILLNEKATGGNIGSALEALMQNAKENEFVYIYFSGHGDIENNTDIKNGYLLCYDSPKTCYSTGTTFPISYLQECANTLANRNITVTIIADACRAGKLTGGEQGRKQTALALTNQWNGITKLISCQPDQSSLESDKWGNGAGLFTYYLIRGLKGFADYDKNGTISVKEIRDYLEENVQTASNNEQSPEISGNKLSTISIVNNEIFSAMEQGLELDYAPIQMFSEKGFEPDLSGIKDFRVLSEYYKFKDLINNNKLINYKNNIIDDENAYSVYQLLKTNKKAESIIESMKRDLLAALQDKSQIAMNSWVNNLRTPSSINKSIAYSELKIAFNLIDSTYFFYNEIKSRYLLWKSMFEGNTKEKLCLLTESLRLDSVNACVFFQLGYYYFENMGYQQSYDNYEKALQLSKNWVNAWDNKGITLIALERFEEAIKSFDIAIALKPEDSDSWYYKGVALEKLKKYEKSIECFDKAIEIEPDNSVAWYNRGIALKNFGHYEEALKSYNKALEIKNDYFDAWINKGNLLKYLGNSDDAIKCYEKATEIIPDLDVAWYSIGNYYYTAMNYEAAIQGYDKVIGINKEHFNAWYNKACAHSLLKNKDEMLNALKRAIELNSKFKGSVKTDEDFKNYWDDPDFKKLVE